MNNTVWRIIFFLIIGGLIFILGRCSKESEKEIITQTITIPGKEGKSDTIFKPKEIFIRKDSIVFNGDTIKTENPFNKDLADKFTKLETDKQKLEEYIKSIQTRTYMIPFEDSLVSIQNHIQAQGSILSFNQEYKIKPQEVLIKTPVNKPQSHINILAGLELGATKELNEFTPKANLFLQTKKGNLYSIGYSTQDSRIWVGTAIKF